MEKLKIEKVKEYLGIKESVIGLYNIGSDVLIHTELKLMLYTNNLKKKKWESDFHKDIISDIKLVGNKILVKEFEGRDEYFLDIKTGKTLLD